jgi:hypothetical protein
VACPAIALAGLDVGVVDNATSQPICDASVTASEEGYTERLSAIGCRYQGAYERPGTYRIRVDRTGFAGLELSDVRVVMSAGQCPHVQTVTVELRLIPQP